MLESEASIHSNTIVVRAQACTFTRQPYIQPYIQGGGASSFVLTLVRRCPEKGRRARHWHHARGGRTIPICICPGASGVGASVYDLGAAQERHRVRRCQLKHRRVGLPQSLLLLRVEVVVVVRRVVRVGTWLVVRVVGVGRSMIASAAARGELEKR